MAQNTKRQFDAVKSPALGDLEEREKGCGTCQYMQEISMIFNFKKHERFCLPSEIRTKENKKVRPVAEDPTWHRHRRIIADLKIDGCKAQNGPTCQKSLAAFVHGKI